MTGIRYQLLRYLSPRLRHVGENDSRSYTILFDEDSPTTLRAVLQISLRCQCLAEIPGDGLPVFLSQALQFVKILSEHVDRYPNAR